ncbi:MAG: sulfur carrier protein ThiS [Candidatus Omnitrophota bacterium]
MILINNRDRLDWQDGMTVTDLLQKMNYSYTLITVTVNGELVPHDDYSNHLVPDHAEVTVFHLAHGG